MSLSAYDARCGKRGAPWCSYDTAPVCLPSWNSPICRSRRWSMPGWTVTTRPREPSCASEGVGAALRVAGDKGSGRFLGNVLPVTVGKAWLVEARSGGTDRGGLTSQTWRTCGCDGGPHCGPQASGRVRATWPTAGVRVSLLISSPLGGGGEAKSLRRRCKPTRGAVAAEARGRGTRKEVPSFPAAGAVGRLSTVYGEEHVNRR